MYKKREARAMLTKWATACEARWGRCNVAEFMRPRPSAEAIGCRTRFVHFPIARNAHSDANLIRRLQFFSSNCGSGTFRKPRWQHRNAAALYRQQCANVTLEPIGMWIPPRAHKNSTKFVAQKFGSQKTGIPVNTWTQN